jgi:hypothetical protein
MNRKEIFWPLLLWAILAMASPTYAQEARGAWYAVGGIEAIFPLPEGWAPPDHRHAGVSVALGRIVGAPDGRIIKAVSIEGEFAQTFSYDRYTSLGGS